ncbi:4Fe-4S ferredoxin iron-sulfur binding domain protein [Methanocaldococcus infernus ME]|uniref:4Fe-4S ferredoxin iron-sulfur binding domain protein n=1 Tax=Methanocaldococcus infernus (strain DSM 11812 / JCM 15783 / ME) TaxID=573063 RepID=D5VTT9_METIM|nr:4Fe-4S binding protein [Methanocaldococcus infernus]ADG13992.1 4Fe-4S ferredoxin iron-sulfur binding domain protein [Methanocaldococcus infernus ME]
MINPSLCISCGKCERICPKNGIFIIDNVPIRCYHCEGNPCLLACPKEAIKRINGKVVIIEEKCIGCGLCALACPFGAIKMSRIAIKCDGCYSLEKELCSSVCPTGAISSLDEINEKKVESTVNKLNILKRIYGLKS